MKPFSEQQQTWGQTEVDNAQDVIQVGPMTIRHDQESIALLQQMIPFLQKTLGVLEREHALVPLPEKETLEEPVLRPNPFHPPA